MISVVICSNNVALAEQVSANVAKTIGITHELLIFDNRTLKKGITTIYNMGADQARYPIVCFVHEDVLFTKQAWGSILAGYFARNSDIGIIGLAGARYKAAIPSGWYTGFQEEDRASIIHRNAEGKEELIHIPSKFNQPLSEVITLDGVFLATTKENMSMVRWDEKHITHFHFYDIDFSVKMFLAGKRNFVTYEIPLIHLTEGGSFCNEWVIEALSWHRRFEKQLPIQLGSTRRIRNPNPKIEAEIAQTWMLFLRKWPIIKALKWKWIKASRIITKPKLLPATLLFWFSKRLSYRN